jgi:hypothetical protein
LKYDNNGYLYAGGNFTNAGGDTDADYLAAWNGTHWYSIGSHGLTENTLNSYVRNIFIDNNNSIHIAGGFTAVGGLTLPDRVAAYTNGSWRTLDIDLPGTADVRMIFIDSRDNFYIGGYFSTTAEGGSPDGDAITSKVAANLAEYSGSANGSPFIQLHGPGVVQSVTNYSTNKTIQFDGLTLQAGEWLNLTLDPHNIKVVSGWRGNCLKYVIPGSDIAGFYLTPDSNYISVLMPSGTTSNSAGWMNWRPKYWSIEGAKYE